MKKQTLVSLAIIALGCAVFVGCSKSKQSSGAGGASDSAVELKVKWTPGKKYVHRMQLAQTSEITMQENAAPIKQVMSMAQDYTISVMKELTNGGRELELEFVNVQLESKMGEITNLTFDSTQPQSRDAGNPLAPVFRKIIGARIKFLTDPSGKVESVEGYKEFAAQMAGNNQQARMVFDSMFGEDVLKQFCDTARGMPDHPVKPGEKWTLATQINAGPVGTLALDMNSTFRNWEQQDNKRCARIDYEGNIGSKPAPAAGPMALDLRDGKMSGSTWFDPELGMAVSSIGEQDMTMKITTQGRIVNSRINQKITLALVEVADL